MKYKVTYLDSNDDINATSIEADGANWDEDDFKGTKFFWLYRTEMVPTGYFGFQERVRKSIFIIPKRCLISAKVEDNGEDFIIPNEIKGVDEPIIEETDEDKKD